MANTIIYDFYSDEYSRDRSTIPEGKVIQFKIVNVNPFRYTTRINSTFYSIQGSRPAAIEPLLPTAIPQVAPPLATQPQGVAVSVVDAARKDYEKASERFARMRDSLKDFLAVGKQLNSYVEPRKVREHEVRWQTQRLARRWLDPSTLPYTVDDFVTRAMTLYDTMVVAFNAVESAVRILKRSGESTFVRLADKVEKAKSEIPSQEECRAIARQVGELYVAIGQAQFSSARAVQATTQMDLIRFDVSVANKDGHDTSFTAMYEVLVTKGIRIDFSTGLVFSRLTDYSYGVADTNFSKPQLPPDSLFEGKYYTDTGQPTWAYGIGAMAHVTYRFSRWFGLQGTIGVALSGNMSAPQYLVGGGFLLGSEQRFSLTFGWAIGKVIRLAPGIYPNTPYETTVAAAPTGSTTKSDIFFSLTYCLGSRKEVGR